MNAAEVSHAYSQGPRRVREGSGLPRATVLITFYLFIYCAAACRHHSCSWLYGRAGGKLADSTAAHHFLRTPSGHETRTRVATCLVCAAATIYSSFSLYNSIDPLLLIVSFKRQFNLEYKTHRGWIQISYSSGHGRILMLTAPSCQLVARIQKCCTH